jgi:hypothetical protein
MEFMRSRSWIGGRRARIASERLSAERYAGRRVRAAYVAWHVPKWLEIAVVE